MVEWYRVIGMLPGLSGSLSNQEVDYCGPALLRSNYLLGQIVLLVCKWEIKNDPGHLPARPDCLDVYSREVKTEEAYSKQMLLQNTAVEEEKKYGHWPVLLV